MIVESLLEKSLLVLTELFSIQRNICEEDKKS